MLKATLKFARLHVSIMLWAIAFVGSAALGDINEKTVLAILLLISWYIHATTINDYADLEIDKINLKTATDRPLLNKGLSSIKLWSLHYLSAGLALSLSVIYGKDAVMFTFVMLLINYAYSLKPLRLSDRGIIAQFVLAFAYVYFPLLLGYWSVAGAGEQFPWLLSIGIYVAFVARTLLKDFRDLTGDKKHGKQTFLVRHGPRATTLLSASLWLVAALIIGYALKLPGAYLVLFLGLVEVLVLLRTLSHSTKHDEQQITITFIAKTANALIITLLVCLLSRNQAIADIEIELLVAITGASLLAFNWLRYTDYRRTLTTPRTASTSIS